MDKCLDIITTLHTSTKRDYLPRMVNNKIECMKVAKKYSYDYWDGDRKYGYGGYKYDGRWEKVAIEIIKNFNLTNNSSILDAGCGKAYLLYEIKKLLPNIKVCGFDFSQHAITNAKEEIKDKLLCHDIKEKFPYKNKEFDLVLSLNTLHNLKVHELKEAISEINRVSKDGYIVVESYRNEEELFNLQCWALTCESFFSKEEWIWLFKEFKYEGKYEFIYFQ